MAHLTRLCISLLLTIPLVAADYKPWEVGPYSTANYCARSCAGAVYGSQAIYLCSAFPPDAACMCNTNGHSSIMNDKMSRCPSIGGCGGAAEGTQGMAIFSAYCAANLGGSAATATTGNAQVVNPTGQASTGATATNAQATSNPTQSSSSNSNNSKDSSNDSTGDSKELSQSDKIAIGCAIGGAIVAIMIAVPGWIALRRRRREDNPDSQPLHNPPQMGYFQYQNPVQQPFLQPQPQPYPQHYPQNGWGWRR